LQSHGIGPTTHRQHKLNKYRYT